MGFLAFALLAAGALATMPTATATNSDWTRVIVGSVTSIANEIQTANNGETVGIAYRFLSNNKVGFSFSATPTVEASWAQSTADVTGAANTEIVGLYGTGTNTWVLHVWLVGTQHSAIYRSTNNGVAWTAIRTDTGTCSCTGSSFASSYGPSTSTLFVHMVDDTYYSTDGGATFTAAGVSSYCDNAGATGQSSTSSNACGSIFGVTGYHNGHMELFWGRGGTPNQGYYDAASTSTNPLGGWTVAYDGASGCPPNYQNLATTVCRIYAASGGFTDTDNYLGFATAIGSSYGFRVLSTGFSSTPYALISTDAPVGSLAVGGGTAEQIISESCSVIGTIHRAVAMNPSNKFMEAFGDCASNGLIVRLKDGVSGTWASTYSSNSGMIPRDVRAMFTPSKAFVVYTNSGAADEMELIWSAAPTVSPALGAVATVAVTGLVGFDVDPTGATAIARTNSGATVRAYGASTLNENANVATNCNVSHGVMAINDHVAYLHCDGSAATDSVRINSPILGAPAQPVACLSFPDAICPYEITNGDIIHPGGHAQIELNGITDFPIDYSRGLGATGSGDSAVVAFAFSTTTGDIGVSIINQHADSADTTSIALANIGESSQPVDQMCVTRDLDGKTYIYAVSTLTNAKGWRVDFRKTDGGEKYAPTLVSVFLGTAGTAGANGVACGLDHFAILKSTSLTVWHCRAACTSAAVSITGLTGTTTGAIAMADDGQTVSYIANTTSWYIRNTTSGATLGTGPTPTTGTFKGMKEHGAGSSLWIASSLEIDRYPTFSVVGNGTDKTYKPPCNGASDTCDDGGDSSSGGSSDDCGALVCTPSGGVGGLSSSALSLFLGMVIVGAFAASMSEKTASGAAGIAIFAVLGLFIGYALGYIHLWVIVALASIGIGAAFMGFRTSSRATGM